jgi:hypothetical protein
MRLSVPEVLETAMLGGIGLWATREQIHERLGSPDAHGPDVWVYGIFELIFDSNDRLIQIFSDHFGRPGVPGIDGRPTDMGGLREGMGLRAVSEHFRRAGWANPRRERCTANAELTYLCFPSGARLMFGPEGLFGLIVSSRPLP